jgi:hypothetical protein
MVVRSCSQSKYSQWNQVLDLKQITKSTPSDLDVGVWIFVCSSVAVTRLRCRDPKNQFLDPELNAIGRLGTDITPRLGALQRILVICTA